MLKILIDQDFDHDILRGLIRRIPEIDYLTNYQLGFSALPDEKLLLEASLLKRVLLTHDRRTMPNHAKTLIEQGEILSGIFIVPKNMPISKAIEELQLLILCTENEDWTNLIQFLPL